MYDLPLYRAALANVSREDLEFLVAGALTQSVNMGKELRKYGIPIPELPDITPRELIRLETLLSELSAELNRLTGR